VDDRDEVGFLQNVTSKVAARRCRFGCVTAPLHVRPDVITHLEFRASIHGLPRQAAVTDELARLGLDNPEPEAVFFVVRLVPVDPGLRLFRSFRPR
jgi:hypothetical protein